jgi:SAM-dependent methyltransferase
VRLDDPELVRREYADETRLATRKAAHASAEGPDAREAVFAAVAEIRPRAILEVGCGEGELAERMACELGADVVAIDQSERMVELARARGVAAEVADVQQLPFDDGSFDCAVAAWVLFHVPDLHRALGELVRVLRPGGRLVAATNGPNQLPELFALLGRTPPVSSFHCANGAEALSRHFARVERRDVEGWLVFPDAVAAQSYVDSMITLAGKVPAVEGPIRVRRTPCVFVADR